MTRMALAAVQLAGEEPCELRTADGIVIEALARVPAASKRAVVLCHPHPLYGGTMHNTVVASLTRVLIETGGDRVATVRFNFRGVERSTGQHGGGESEVLDVVAAIDHVRQARATAPISLAGYSFGARVALKTAQRDSRVERLALVAPAVSHPQFGPRPSSVRSIPVEIVVGDRDEHAEVGDVRQLAAALGAKLHVLADTEHSFVGERLTVAKTLAPFLAPEACT